MRATTVGLGRGMTGLSEKAKALLDGPTFVGLATINADGSPQSSTMWAGRDGDDVVFSTLVGRQKYKNVVRDPRVSVLITDPDNGESHVEVRGVATFDESESGGRELIDALSWKYRGKGFPQEDPSKVRVVMRVTPTKVIDHN